MTWSVGRLCSFSPSFTSRSQICSRTNIRRVAIENPRISLQIWRYFTAIQWILVQPQNWQREVKERLKLHNLNTDHIVIRSELKYSIGAKVAGTVIWNCGPGSTQPKNSGFMSGPGNNPAKTEWVVLLGGSWPGRGPSGRFQPGPKPGNPELLLTLSSGVIIIMFISNSTIPLTIFCTPWYRHCNYNTQSSRYLNPHDYLQAICYQF